MKKRVIYAAETVAAAVVAAVSSAGYAKTGWAWLLCVTGCAVMAFLLCLIACIRAWRNPAQNTQKMYRKKAAYISAPEREFLWVLRSIVGNRYEVCVQAPLVSVIDKVAGGAFRNELFRVADYLIADAVSFAPLLLIELNDASHNRADRRERDRKVAEICADAGIALVTFTLAQAQNVPEVRKAVLRALK